MGFVVFTAGPMIASLILSLTRYDIVHAPGLGRAWTTTSSCSRATPSSGIHCGVTVTYAVVAIPLGLAFGLPWPTCST